MAKLTPVQYVVFFIALLLAGGIGWLANDRFTQVSGEEVAVRVQDQMRRVAQIATAEARYSRLIRYDDPGATDWFPGTDKRVIVKADARVLMGYNLEGVSVSVDEQEATLTVSNWPQPQELAFELDTEFFDIKEGWFVRIGREYLNAIDDRARARMRKEADYEALTVQSEAQASALLDVLRTELSAQGWTLNVLQDARD